MNIGDKVITKKTGLPGLGTIVGIITPDYMKGWIPHVNEPNSTWNRVYPEWALKPCYIIKFAQPQKPCNMDEVRYVMNNHGCYDEEIILSHFNEQQNAIHGVYPADDLEILF